MQTNTSIHNCMYTLTQTQTHPCTSIFLRTSIDRRPYSTQSSQLAIFPNPILNPILKPGLNPKQPFEVKRKCSQFKKKYPHFVNRMSIWYSACSTYQKTHTIKERETVNIRQNKSLHSPFFLFCKAMWQQVLNKNGAQVLKGKLVVSKRKQGAAEKHLEALKAWLN